MEYIVGQLLHGANLDCEVAEAEKNPTTTTRAPQGVPECICLKIKELLSADVQIQGVIDVRQKLSAEIDQGMVTPVTFYRALATEALMPEEAREEAFRDMLRTAQKLCAYDLERLKRMFIKQAILGDSHVYECGRQGRKLQEAFSDAWRTLENQSHSVMDYKQLPLMLDAWVESGDVEEMKTLALTGGQAWTSGKSRNEGFYAERNKSVLITHGAWVAQLQLLESVIRGLEKLLEDSPYEIVVVNDWTRKAGTSGVPDYWGVVATHEILVKEDVLAVKVPRWIAAMLSKMYPADEAGYVRKTRVVRLSEVLEEWRGHLEIALVLWRDAGGSFTKNADSYGRIMDEEGYKNLHEAWLAAKRIDA